MSNRNSVDSTGTLFFTKYSDPNKLTTQQRRKFRSTFQASKIGDQNKMNEIQQMFNNYNLFKYGQVITSTVRRNSTTQKRISVDVPQNNQGNQGQGSQYVSVNKYKNRKERVKDNQLLMGRLNSMRNQRQTLFQKLHQITSKNPRRNH